MAGNARPRVGSTLHFRPEVALSAAEGRENQHVASGTRDSASGSGESAESAEEVLVAAGAERAREMYRRFLESDYPDALAMAEQVLRIQPDDVMALAIRTECQAALCKPETVPVPASSEPHRTDSDMPTSVEVAPPPVTADELPSDESARAEDATPVYVTVSHNEPSREMCRRFLESDHPTALLLAESVLASSPNDRMARAVAEQCRAALEALEAIKAERDHGHRPEVPSSMPPSNEAHDDTQVSLPPLPPLPPLPSSKG